jgi:hypothetical protein
MTDGRDHTVASARQAAARDDLGAWVADFLASPDSDNAALAEQLSEPPRWWSGPVELPISHLHRMAGPPGAPVMEPVDDDDWRDDVDEIAESFEDGVGLPPVVVSYRGGQLVLEDGNHRVEGARRAGHDEVWAVIAFEDPEQRERFVPPEVP